MRIRNLPLKSHNTTEIDLFIRTEHLKPATAKLQGHVTGILEQAIPPSIVVTSLEYVTQCTQTTCKDVSFFLSFQRDYSRRWY